ncbi:MAG: phosphoribosyl-AMP cyclohydrolase [Methanobrevibacter sp.]|nr:phosphoribosyl-AMP cyclohydrolase [Methanobrevibacter sp.]
MELNFRLNMGGEDLVIGVAQDYQTNEVLMVAFMNKEAVEQTLKTKKAHYYSTSRQKQWLKGESSGNVQEVKEMYIDCDADAIIMKVDQIGAACHEGYRSCFFRQLDIENENIDLDNISEEDIKIISKRLFDPKEMYG